jgi:hypothetical protein
MDMQGSRCQMLAAGSDRAEGVLFCHREPVLALKQRCYWSACGSLLGQAGKVQPRPRALKARFNHVSRSSALTSKPCIDGVCSLTRNELPDAGWLTCDCFSMLPLHQVLFAFTIFFSFLFAFAF